MLKFGLPMVYRLPAFVLVCFLLAGCAAAAPQPTLTASPTLTLTFTPPPALPVPSTPSLPVPGATRTSQPTGTPAATRPAPALPTGTPAPSATRQPPVAWQELPVLPVLSARALEIYRRGLAQGANPHAFAKAGDCETLTDWFLVDFERGPRYYNLGPYQVLQAAIDYYRGSLGRSSLAARRGFNAAALLTTFWTDQSVCKPDETPLGCEFRLTRPAFVLIMVGTNDVARKSGFETALRKVIEFSVAQNVLPVLVTKADNLEGDESINAAIGRLAQEYELPVWNFWRAVQDLPSRGLVEDAAHLTHAPNDFSDPINLQAAWPVRNLNALQVLEIMMKAANDF
jgi:hypothetical protein